MGLELAVLRPCTSVKVHRKDNRVVLHAAIHVQTRKRNTTRFTVQDNKLTTTGVRMRMRVRCAIFRVTQFWRCVCHKSNNTETTASHSYRV